MVSFLNRYRNLFGGIFFIGLFSIFTYALTAIPALTLLDQTIHTSLQPMAQPVWLAIHNFFSFLGKAEFLFFLVFILFTYLASKGLVREGFWLALTIALGLGINAGLKTFFERARPLGFEYLKALESFSYPSGHTVGAILFYLCAHWTLTKLNPSLKKNGSFKTIIFLVIFLVSFSRIFLGVHWFTDILGGTLIGLAWYHFSIFFGKKFLFA